jgi:hypothetical protein
MIELSMCCSDEERVQSGNVGDTEDREADQVETDPLLNLLVEISERCFRADFCTCSSALFCLCHDTLVCWHHDEDGPGEGKEGKSPSSV